MPGPVDALMHNKNKKDGTSNKQPVKRMNARLRLAGGGAINNKFEIRIVLRGERYTKSYTMSLCSRLVSRYQTVSSASSSINRRVPNITEYYRRLGVSCKRWCGTRTAVVLIIGRLQALLRLSWESYRRWCGQRKAALYK